MILADLHIGGKLRKVIMQAPKNGFFYVLDRGTGKFISAVPFAYVTWATGLDPKTGRPIEAPDARYDAKGVFLSPSNNGAHNWPTMSFSADTGLAYLPASNTTFFYKEDASHFRDMPGLVKRGLSLDPEKLVGEQELVAPPADRPKGSFLLAWNPVTQKESWRVPDVNGSTMTTAGNLVFSSSIDGHFMAFSSDKGDKLWQAQLVPGFGSPVTYRLDGKQYVSVLAGRSGHGRIYTFALDAHAELPTSLTGAHALTAATAAGKTTKTGVFSEAQAARGQTQYSQSCGMCHMADLSGNGSAIPLAGSSFTHTWNGHTLDELYSVIATTMPQGKGGSLTPEAYADIVAYTLKANGSPSGPDDLKADREMLKSSTIVF